MVSPVWRYEGGSGSDATITPTKRGSLSQEDDGIYLAGEFELADASRHFDSLFQQTIPVSITSNRSSSDRRDT
jgi:hypothetical protein